VGGLHLLYSSRNSVLATETYNTPTGYSFMDLFCAVWFGYKMAACYKSCVWDTASNVMLRYATTGMFCRMPLLLCPCARESRPWGMWLLTRDSGHAQEQYKRDILYIGSGAGRMQNTIYYPCYCNMSGQFVFSCTVSSLKTCTWSTHNEMRELCL
jgi:hypothetical protein